MILVFCYINMSTKNDSVKLCLFSEVFNSVLYFPLRP